MSPARRSLSYRFGTHRPARAEREVESGVALQGGLEVGVIRPGARRLVGRVDADFRDGQDEAVLALVRDRSRVLVVQRTGWGKSAVCFVTRALLRAQRVGPTVIISPLLALVRDQIAAPARSGIRAVTMNSANWERLKRQVGQALHGKRWGRSDVKPRKHAPLRGVEMLLRLVESRSRRQPATD